MSLDGDEIGLWRALPLQIAKQLQNLCKAGNDISFNTYEVVPPVIACL